jgi:hypothetical protein
MVTCMFSSDAFTSLAYGQGEEKEEEDLDELEEKKAKGGRGKIEGRRRKRR